MDAFPILYADDDDNDVFILNRAIERAAPRSELHTVPDGLNAIEYLSGHGGYADRNRYPLPKIVLTDLKMRRVSGIGLLRWIRQQPQFATLPVVLVSSSGKGSDIQAAFELGANGYVAKMAGVPILVRELGELFALCASHDFSVTGWLSFEGNQPPPPGARSDATHPAGVLDHGTWNPTLRHSEY